MEDSAVFHTVLRRKICLCFGEEAGGVLGRSVFMQIHRTPKHFLCIRGAHNVLTFQNQSIPLCY